jgi:hypothetical protein
MRNDWSKQAQRIYEFMRGHPNEEIPAPVLQRIAAGDGQYVASISKRISECRQRFAVEGQSLTMCRQEWINGQRHTFYKLSVPGASGVVKAERTEKTSPAVISLTDLVACECHDRPPAQLNCPQ